MQYGNLKKNANNKRALCAAVSRVYSNVCLKQQDIKLVGCYMKAVLSKRLAKHKEDGQSDSHRLAIKDSARNCAPTLAVRNV